MNIAKKTIFEFGSMFMLTVYMVVFLFGNWHDLIHQSNHLHHTVIEDSDPCHLAIYHGDIPGACDHENHFAKKYPKCDLCDTLTTQYLSSKGDYPVLIEFPLTEDQVFRPLQITKTLRFSGLSYRGPPSSVLI